MDEQKYSIVDVLGIIKGQLLTIPVQGQHVSTMAAAMSNLDALMIALQQKEKAVVENGGVSP